MPRTSQRGRRRVGPDLILASTTAVPGARPGFTKGTAHVHRGRHARLLLLTALRGAQRSASAPAAKIIV